MKRLAKDLEEMFLKEYKWGRLMTSNQVGFMIGWGTSTIPKKKYVTIEIPFLILQIYIN